MSSAFRWVPCDCESAAVPTAPSIANTLGDKMHLGGDAARAALSSSRARAPRRTLREGHKGVRPPALESGSDSRYEAPRERAGGDGRERWFILPATKPGGEERATGDDTMLP